MAENNQDPFKEFDVAKQRARSQARQLGQEQVGAIGRRFASLGGGPTGARIKQEQLARERAFGLGQQAVGQLNLQEQQQRLQVGEAQRQRDFAARQQGLQRDLATSEAQRQREFAGGQAELQRGFAGEQSELQREFASREAGRQRQFQQGLENRRLDLTGRGLDLEEQAQSFNKLISAFSVPDHVNMISVLSGLGEDPTLPDNIRRNIQGFLSSTTAEPTQTELELLEQQRLLEQRRIGSRGGN